MADNRMYLVCVACARDEYATAADSMFYLAKYYSSQSWYTPNRETFLEDLNRWLDIHKHGMGGETIGIGYEGNTPPRRSGLIEKSSIVTVDQEIFDCLAKKPDGWWNQ